MILLPAIDLMDGQVVRLERGEAERKTVYSDDPAAMARRWESEGGDWLHIVDLDAAFSGVPANPSAVRSIRDAVSIPIELGGGMRSTDAIRTAIEAGVNRVVIGSRAAESLDFVREAVKTFGAERIAVGIDARDGLAAVQGWTKTTRVRATDLARAVEGAGAGTLIYTDIATDGMLGGPNIAGLRALLESVRIPVIASGGVSCEADLHELDKIDALYGAIIGKALYDKRLSLSSYIENRPS